MSDQHGNVYQYLRNAKMEDEQNSRPRDVARPISQGSAYEPKALHFPISRLFSSPLQLSLLHGCPLASLYPHQR